MAVVIAKDLANNHGCYLYQLVSNDDSTTCANLSHSFRTDLIVDCGRPKQSAGNGTNLVNIRLNMESCHWHVQNQEKRWLT